MSFSTLPIATPPSVLKETIKAFFTTKRPAADPSQAPGLEGWLRGIAFDELRVVAYAQLCGFAPSRRVPLSYPQVLALPLHLALGNDPRFPFRLPGMVHIGNRFEQTAPLAIGDVVDLRAWTQGSRESKLGTEADLHTECYRDGERVWQSTTTIVFKRAAKSPSDRKEPPPAEGDGAAWTPSGGAWEVPEDQGRRYAAVSGDYNPIHLYGWSAKLFGFKRPIVHGMWTLARCIAELERSKGDQPLTQLQAQFRSPLFLPSAAQFATRDASQGKREFRLTDARTSKLIVLGSTGV